MAIATVTAPASVSATASINFQSAHHLKLQQLRQQANDRYLEREEEITGILTCLLSGEHAVLLGDPGTGKSYMVGGILGAFQGSYFQWLMTRFTKDDELFGPVKMSGLKNDKLERNTFGRLPEANMAFLDEVFKANSSVLNALLTILNEKVYYNDGTPVKAPLQTLIGASNELPEEGEGLAALYDRFVLRYWVNPLERDSSWETLMLRTSGVSATPQITVSISQAELALLQKEAQAVTFNAETISVLKELRSLLRNENIIISERRWVKLIGIVKAFAYLNGESEATEDHFSILVHSLWSDKDQIREIKRIIGKVGNPLAQKANEILKAAREEVAKLDVISKADTAGEMQWMGQATITLQALTSMITELDVIIASAKTTNRAKAPKQAKQEIERISRKLGTEASSWFGAKIK
jgi:MoxR-like ATPase